MSFYSYKNANAEASPGTVCGNVLNGLNKRVCIQVKNVYDSCLCQEQLDDEKIVISNIVPVLPGDCRGNCSANCNCTCCGNECTCSCDACGVPISHEQAVENAENSPCPLPSPCGTWTFESCRSSTTKGRITNLCVERLCDRPQFARVKATVDVPIDVLFTDQRCQEWVGQAVLQVDRDVLLCIPDDSIIPFTLESLVSAICVSGSYIGNCTFEITICVTIVLKVLAEVDIMVPWRCSQKTHTPLYSLKSAIVILCSFHQIRCFLARIPASCAAVSSPLSMVPAPFCGGVKDLKTFVGEPFRPMVSTSISGSSFRAL